MAKRGETIRRPAPAAVPCTVTVVGRDPEWEAFLRRTGEATLFHSPAWGQVMASAYRNRPFYLTARRSGEVVGALQLVLQRSALFGSHLFSLPYFDAAGVLADDDAAVEALVSAAERLMLGLGAEWVELRQGRPLDMPLADRTDKVTLKLDLPNDPDVLWKALKAKVRNQVRRAERERLVACDGGRELLDEFHAIYARNMRDLGSPPHSRSFFRSILDRLGAAARLFVVRQADRPVAASFTLVEPGETHVPWAASDWRCRQLCGNMLLYWRMLSFGCESGLGRFDFGRSTRDSGTYHFKRQWSAEEVPLHWQFILPRGRQGPELRPDSPKYRLATACWQKLPVAVSAALGPRIISKLS